jgi:hypothetical protein
MKYEEEIFEKMLCGMYLLPYKFTMADDINHLTSIADYYRALPIVSRTFTDALLKSPCINSSSYAGRSINLWNLPRSSDMNLYLETAWHGL